MKKLRSLCYLEEALTNWTTKIGCPLTCRYACMSTVCSRCPVFKSCIPCWVWVSWWRLSLSPSCSFKHLFPHSSLSIPNKAHWVNKDISVASVLASVISHFARVDAYICSVSPGKVSHTTCAKTYLVLPILLYTTKLILKRKHLAN